MPVSRQAAKRDSRKAASRKNAAEKRRGDAAKGEKRGSATPADPRANQRERTRAAIMEGARKLLREGKVPSIADAAEEAHVSRATAYRYFPTQGALIREAVDSVLIQENEWEGRLEDTDDLGQRVDEVTAEMFELLSANQALLRGALLLALQQWAKHQAGEELGEEPIQRGGRRVGIRVALEPFRDRLDPDALRRLAIALSIVIGIEAQVILRDIWHLDEEEAKRTTLWLARALAQAALQEGRSGGAG